MFRPLLTVTLLAALAGCGGGGGGSTDSTPTPRTAKESLQALETAGDIPALERGASVAGTDSNANGVRDDVETYIQTQYASASAPQRTAALQYARGMQAALVVDPADSTAVKAVKRQLSRANHCLYARFDSSSTVQPAAVGAQLRAVTTNTKARLLAYLAYSKALDGTSWAMPEGDTCE